MAYKSNAEMLGRDVDKTQPTKAVQTVVKAANAMADLTKAMKQAQTSTTPAASQAAPAASIASPSVAAPSAQFQVSQSYTDAMNYTNQLLQKLESGRTAYTDQIKGLMDQIQNRDPFAYDMDKDTLFQQYLKAQTETGRQAMMDTAGQAAALTGGYGSTYATSAANQQYNAYIRQAYDNLPQYYAQALDAYQAEGDDLYRRLGMFNDADQTEYQRLLNAYNANYGRAQDMYGQEFDKWNAETGYAWDAAQFAYQQQRDAVADKQWAAEFGLKQANAANSSSSSSSSSSQTMSEADKLKWAQLEFDKEQAQVKADQWEKEFALKAAASNGDSKSTGSSSNTKALTQPTQTMMSKGLEAWNEYARTGDINAYLRFYDSIPESYDKSLLDDYVEMHGDKPVSKRGGSGSRN